MAEQLGLNEKDTLIEVLDQMGEDELIRLRKQANTILKRKRTRQRGLPVSGYVRKDDLPYLPLVLEWLQSKQYIKKQTHYNLTSFALHTLIENVLTSIKEEAAKKVPPPRVSEQT